MADSLALMAARPEVFISATTQDLKSTRQVLCDSLLTTGCVPIVQDHFAPDARTAREMLRDRIAACDAVLHLAGECYATEPRERGSGELRCAPLRVSSPFAGSSGLKNYRLSYKSLSDPSRRTIALATGRVSR